MHDRRARDLELLDALDARKGASYDGPIWRVVREGRDPLIGASAKARWDPGTFDVIYTSLQRDGALEEIYFHLSRQPIFPSRVRFLLHEITVRTNHTLELADMGAIERLGVSKLTYLSLDYQRTQEIADAAFFLGFDGLIAPSARWPCQNLVLFAERFDPNDLLVVNSESVDWEDWRVKRTTAVRES